MENCIYWNDHWNLPWHSCLLPTSTNWRHCTATLPWYLVMIFPAPVQTLGWGLHQLTTDVENLQSSISHPWKMNCGKEALSISSHPKVEVQNRWDEFLFYSKLYLHLKTPFGKLLQTTTPVNINPSLLPTRWKECLSFPCESSAKGFKPCKCQFNNDPINRLCITHLKQFGTETQIWVSSILNELYHAWNIKLHFSYDEQ